MNFPPCAGRVSGRATPSLRHAPRAKLQRTNPGSSPLSLRGILCRRSDPALGAQFGDHENLRNQRRGFDPRRFFLCDPFGEGWRLLARESVGNSNALSKRALGAAENAQPRTSIGASAAFASKRLAGFWGSKAQNDKDYSVHPTSQRAELPKRSYPTPNRLHFPVASPCQTPKTWYSKLFTCSGKRGTVNSLRALENKRRVMYNSPQKRSDPDVQELRRAGGVWLRELREKCGLSQRQLAGLVGAEYYTFISQLETGRGRVPPDRYRVWAEALQVEADYFVKRLLSYYDPITYEILFGRDG
jgi:hypothetical protein